MCLGSFTNFTICMSHRNKAYLLCKTSRRCNNIPTYIYRDYLDNQMEARRFTLRLVAHSCTTLRLSQRDTCIVFVYLSIEQRRHVLPNSFRIRYTNVYTHTRTHTHIYIYVICRFVINILCVLFLFKYNSIFSE